VTRSRARSTACRSSPRTNPGSAASGGGGGGGPPGFARRPETRAANGGGAPNGLDALPHAGHASLPSPNGSPVGGGEEPVGGGKSRRGRGRFGADGRGARGGKSAKSNGGGGKGDQPGAGPKTLPKPRIAPQTQ
jgi:hypothetical protein